MTKITHVARLADDLLDITASAMAIVADCESILFGPACHLHRLAIEARHARSINPFDVSGAAGRLARRLDHHDRLVTADLSIMSLSPLYEMDCVYAIEIVEEISCAARHAWQLEAAAMEIGADDVAQPARKIAEDAHDIARLLLDRLCDAKSRANAAIDDVLELIGH